MCTYDDGSHIDYTYSADGVKLRADYYLPPTPRPCPTVSSA